MRNTKEHCFQLRFGLGEIHHWSSRYAYPGEPELLETVVPRIRNAGYRQRYPPKRQPSLHPAPNHKQPSP